MNAAREKVSARPPIVTLLLIGANLLAAFFVLANPDSINDWGFRALYPRFQTAFTSLFLHANVLHLLGNMIFLAAVGAAVEISTGTARFSIVYFVGGIFGVAAHWLAVRTSQQPPVLIGASGAIASCAAYYGVRYRQLRVPILPNKPAPVIAIVFVWIFLQLLGGLVRIGDDTSVSYWAHLGGALAGVLMSVIFVAPDFGQLKLKHEALERMNIHGPAAVAAAAKEHLRMHPKDIRAIQELAGSAQKMGDIEEERKALYMLFDVLPDSERKDVVRRLVEMKQTDGFTFTQLLKWGDLLAAESPEVSQQLLRNALELSDSKKRPDVLIQLVGVCRESNPAEAQTYLAELQTNYHLHPATELAKKRGWL